MTKLENKIASERARNLLRCALLGGVSALTIGAFSAPAFAQDAAASDASPDIETVVVTGILGSLQRDLDIKRNSLGLVDAISSEDIGKFPDSSLAAAMQRIPGVTISRGISAGSMGNPGGTGSTGSSGDATQITVRGFGPNFNETLYDGRQVSTGIGNRGFDFSAVSADFVSEIDILKSPDSTLSAGAIGATINVVFPKPFDHPGLKVVGSVSTSFEPNQGNPTPNADVLISDTFANDTFGVLVDASYNDTKSLNNHVNIQAWNGQLIAPSQLAGAATGASTTPSINSWAIQDYGIYQEHTDEARETGRLVLQWRPSDALEVTVNDDFSRDRVHQKQYGYSVWFNAGSMEDVVQNSHGTITSFNQPNTPTDFQGEFNGSVLQNNEAGFNAKYTASDKLSLVFDYDFAESWLNPGSELTSIDADVGYGPSGPGGINAADVGIAGVGVGQLPFPTSVGPNGNSADFLGTGIIGSHVLPMNSVHNYDAVNQAKVEADWTEDHIQIKVGVDYMTDDFNTRNYDEQGGATNDWQAYAGYGPLSNNQFGVTLPQGMFTNSFSTANFISGFGNSSSLPAQVLQYNPLPVLNYLESLGNPQATNIPGFNYGCCTPPFTGKYTISLEPSQFNQIYEDTMAAYMRASDETSVGGLPLKINIGLREEVTSVKSTGLGQIPVGFTISPGDHTAYQVAYNPVFEPVTGTNRYTNLLPNLDFALQVTDDLQIRLDASRTLTKPSLEQAGGFPLSPVQSLQATRLGDVTATAGNPQLKPYISDNVDISAEYYYAPNSYFSIDGFNKNVDNFIVNGSAQKTLTGIVDPNPANTTGADISYTLTTPVNGPSAEVNGLEIGVQNVFGDSGWGFQANATVVSTNKPYDPTNLLVSGFAITGLANSANFVGFYDKDGFQARVAVNWRAGYLDHFGQIQNGSIFGTEPTFVNSTTQVDFSSSYDLTEHLNVYFEALNLSDATYSTHGRYAEQLLDANDYGRTFELGVHWKL